ncbi:MAG: hypothetical protein D6806_02735 [Deltaproteobacteria bacterium]|nr:MAG: hypothetical protein D6806_02735 [Deltaproteobacteria bacterium]
MTGDGRFYFLEINARLQVEHPVTEQTCGVDLVEEQLRIAAGNRLSMTQEEIMQRGHAIECRIVAEDPASGWRPCPGRIECVLFPRGPGIRIDIGIGDGSAVSPFYDPLLAKLVCWGKDRLQAANRALWALERTCIAPVETNTGILQEVLRHDDFLNGSFDTAWLERFSEGWFPVRLAVERLVAGWLLGELAATRQSATPASEEACGDPWHTLSGWRLERD